VKQTYEHWWTDEARIARWATEIVRDMSVTILKGFLAGLLVCPPMFIARSILTPWFSVTAVAWAFASRAWISSCRHLVHDDHSTEQAGFRNIPLHLRHAELVIVGIGGCLFEIVHLHVSFPISTIAKSPANNDDRRIPHRS
jgi:hypothetical protein